MLHNKLPSQHRYGIFLFWDFFVLFLWRAKQTYISIESKGQNKIKYNSNANDDNISINCLYIICIHVYIITEKPFTSK